VTVLQGDNRETFSHQRRFKQWIVGRVGSWPREVCRMRESFGARLRQRREDQQIELSAIAEQTKIKLSLLEGLERDDVSRWPSGIFRRAFIRAYAHAIALPPDEVVREFLDRYPDPLEDPATATFEAVAESALDGGGPPTRFRFFVGAAVARLRPGIGQKPAAHVVDSARAYADRPDIPDTLEAPAALANDAVALEGPEIAATLMAAETQMAPETVAAPETAVVPETAVATETAVAAEIPLPPAYALPIEPDLSAAAYLCTELGRVEDPRHVTPLLGELARLVDAVGLIVWVWDPHVAALTPTLPYGYSDEVLAQLPNLPRDARNATAAAFRSAQMCSVSGGEVASDALVLPLLTPAGCAGVLAIELQHGGAGREPIQALATIFAAQMARVVGAMPPVAAASRRLA
jgi:cytoskeletal protein RodZ